MCRNPIEEIVEKFSTFIKVDDSNLDSRRRQHNPKLGRSVRQILESHPEITTEQDLANYLLKFVLKNQHLLRLILEKKDGNCQQLEPKEQELLNARRHLSAYLDETCYWQALKIYDKLQRYNYNLEKKEIFLMARAVAANPEYFDKYNPRKASLKTFAGMVIHGKVLDALRKGREKEKYSPTGLLRNISKKELKSCLNQAISNSSEIEPYLLAWQCFNEIYKPTIQKGNKKLELPSNEQLNDIAKLYEKRGLNKEKITSEEIKQLLNTCVQAIIQANITTIRSLDAIDLEQNWENVSNYDIRDEGEYLELQQQMQEVLVDEFLSFPDDIQKMLELMFGLNITQKEEADYFLMIHYTNVGRRVKKYRKKLSLALSKKLSLTLSSEKLNLIHQYIVQFLNNYCTDKFGDFLSQMIYQESSETIHLLTVFYGKYSGDILKATEYLKASESDLENELERVKQELQSELENYVAHNYSNSLLESQSVKKKIATFIEKSLYEYPYANIH